IATVEDNGQGEKKRKAPSWRDDNAPVHTAQGTKAVYQVNFVTLARLAHEISKPELQLQYHGKPTNSHAFKIKIGQVCNGCALGQCRTERMERKDYRGEETTRTLEGSPQHNQSTSHHDTTTTLHL
ncbi:hypothetical protein Bbelb_429130, partial [Branchiostoma belcheri]